MSREPVASQPSFADNPVAMNTQSQRGRGGPATQQVGRKVLPLPEKDLSRDATASQVGFADNPMAMNMMKSMPGFDEIINDKDKFRERMLESRKQFEDMKAERAAAKAAESAAASEFDD